MLVRWRPIFTLSGDLAGPLALTVTSAEVAVLESPLLERVARLEGQVSGFDGRFDALDQGIAGLHRRFEAVDRRFETMDRRIDALDQKISRQFVWLVGIQVSVLLAVVAALTGG